MPADKNDLIEPSIIVRDTPAGPTILASRSVAALLRSEARDEFDRLARRIGSLGEAAGMDWEELAEARSLVSEAADALGVIRATTAAPEGGGE